MQSPSGSAAPDIDALVAALRVGDLRLASELIGAGSGFLGVSAEVAADLLPLLDAIPSASLQRFPVLEVCYGVILAATPGRADVAAARLAEGAEAARVRAETIATPLEAFVLAGAEVCALRLLGRFDDGVAATQRLIDADARLANPERARLGGMYPLFVGQAVVNAIYAGDAVTARRLAGIELDWSSRMGMPTRVNTALGHAALVEILAGRYLAGKRLLGRIRRESWLGEGWRDGVASGTAVIAIAYAAMNDGDPDTALEIVRSFEESDALGEHWALAAALKALALALTSHLRTAEAVLDVAIRGHSDPGGESAAHAAGVIDLHAVFRIVSGAEPRSDARAASGRVAVFHESVRALRAAASGDIESAIATLARAETLRNSPLDDFILATTGVSVVARTDDEAALRHFVARMLAVMDADGIRWPVGFLDPREREKALSVVSSPRLAGELERAFAAFPPVGARLGPMVNLTHRETVVLRALARTDSRPQLAKELVLSENTVKTQLRAVYRKLAVHDRSAALLKAVELGLLNGP